MPLKESFKKLPGFLLCITWCVFSGNSPAISEVFSYKSDSSSCLLLPAAMPGDFIVHRNYYSLCYSKKHKQPEWVAYRLTRTMGENIAYKRAGRFKPDPLIGSGLAQASDYKGSGFDKGHLCAAGDMRWSKTAMDETFYMSNIAPQQPGFNRGIWNTLEQKVRTWALQNTEIFIITGGLLQDELPHIGENKVSIPNYFYKAIVDIHPPDFKAIAFIMENKPTRSSLLNFAVSVDSLERFIQRDLFPALPDSLENSIESEVSMEKWLKNNRAHL